MKKLTVIFALLLLIGCDTRAEQAPTSSLLAGGAATAAEFLDIWRAGNMVALIRHTERCDHSDNPCLDGDRGITIVGRNMAEQLGKFFTELPEVNRRVYTSPAKRTEQTTTAMFGDNHAKADWLGRGCITELYHQVLDTKQPGENLLLVTHSNCIMEFGEADGHELVSLDLHDFESFGIVLFFHMDGDLLRKGHLLPTDWPTFLTALTSLP